MSAPYSEPCPKCGGTAHGPFWNRTVDCLEYRCACGYVVTRPTEDYTHPAEAVVSTGNALSTGTKPGSPVIVAWVPAEEPR